MRHELPKMISLTERLLAADVPGIFATLVSTQGSSYRPLGSMMVALPGAGAGAGVETGAAAPMRAGGVSGGCLEAYVARHGCLLTHDQPAALLRFRTGDGDDRADVPVLGCGGSLEVLVERLSFSHLALLKELESACSADEPSFLICTVECSNDTIVVNRRWLRDQSSGQHGDFQPLQSIADRALHERKSQQATFGDGRSVLVHYIPPVTRLVIFGAGDDAQPLCDLGRSLGWHVTVADRRARLATHGRFPNADAVVAGDWEHIVREVRFSPRTAAVLMTHSLPDDALVLSLLTDKPRAYLSALGPAHRRRWVAEEASTTRKDRLRASGEQRISADRSVETPTQPPLRGPAGLDLGDRSAPGIAVAIAAEIMAVLNDRNGLPLSATAPHSAASTNENNAQRESNVPMVAHA